MTVHTFDKLFRSLNAVLFTSVALIDGPFTFRWPHGAQEWWAVLWLVMLGVAGLVLLWNVEPKR